MRNLKMWRDVHFTWLRDVLHPHVHNVLSNGGNEEIATSESRGRFAGNDFTSVPVFVQNPKGKMRSSFIIAFYVPTWTTE